jgi:hypothetical protein
VHSVDDAEVASAKRTNPQNGNQVRVVPGAHAIHVAVTGLRPAAWTFNLDAAAGNSYLIEPAQGAGVGLSVTEQPSGRQIPVK